MPEPVDPKPGKPILAINPIASEANSFTGRFSASLDRSRFQVVPWQRTETGRGRYEIVLFHWPNSFFGPAKADEVKILARMLLDKIRRGTKYVWVVHNIRPHDRGDHRVTLTGRLFLRLLDGVILLSENSRQLLLSAYPALAGVRSLVTVHGRYEDAYGPPQPSRAGEGNNRLLFFGLIRTYKNVEALVTAAAAVEAAPFRLTVIGSCDDPALAARIRAAGQGDPRIRLDLRTGTVPGEELEAAIDAQDAVVLPYRNILNSGAALHALSRNKPVLAPRIGSLPELQAMAGEAWVELFDGDISTAVIERFLAGLAAPRPTGPDLSAFAWDRIGADVSRFLGDLLG